MPICELCSRNTAMLKRAKIEDAVLDVCEQCSKTGEILAAPNVIAPRFSNQRFEKKIYVDEIVAGFGKKIRDVRQKKEWDVKKLAEVLHTKESLMHKIESEKIKPDLELARKIEHVLGINLIEKMQEIEVEKTHRNDSSMTMANFIKVKKKK